MVINRIMFTVGNVDRYICRHLINIAVDSRLPVDRQSAHYRSSERKTIGRVSIICRWYIGQLSVTYHSCVNLAGESSGFPFERLSYVIMLLGKMLQSEAWLLYEVNRRAIRTKGMTIFPFVPIVSSIGQVSVKYRRSVGQVSVKYQSSIGEVSVTWKAMSADIHLSQLSTEYQPSLNRVSIDGRPSGDRVSIECRPLRRPI